MKTKQILTMLLVLICAVFVGCLPLSFVGTSTEEVLASRTEETTSSTTSETVEIIEPEEVTEPELYYAIGDCGPAGGFVFYDKGEFSDGWRYMEIAPVETEGDWMEWGASGIFIGETREDIGTGLENTQRIVSELGNSDPKTGYPYPALLCDRLLFNGYDDWYLPSIRELELVYTNLIETGKGDFPNTVYGIPNYWSSTEDNSSLSGAFALYLIGGNGTTSSGNRQLPSRYRAARRF